MVVTGPMVETAVAACTKGVPHVVAAAAAQCCTDRLALVARPEALRKMARHVLPVLLRCETAAWARLAPAPVMRRT
eukprot:12930155-Prorocentrum_lima.AAC.1